MKLKILSLLCAVVMVLTLYGCAARNGDLVDVSPENGIRDESPESGALDTGVMQMNPVESELTAEAEKVIADTGEAPAEIPGDAVQITGKITISTPGDYYVSTSIEGKKITVECEGVRLYLSGAALSNEKKVIESINGCGLTITLFGENIVSNSNASGSNAIDCEGDLIINGAGSLSVTSTKNAIKANSITVVGATLNIHSDKDGLHAEVDAYDSAETEPVPSYSDGGYVYLNGATVHLTSADDGIQADTFIYITESAVTIQAGGGAPSAVTSATSDNASGKGIKAGALDWGESATDLEWDGYLVCVRGGQITVNANDDAIHSNGDVEISGGQIVVSSGDDGVHADHRLIVSGGTIEVCVCYEGLEGTDVDITGGEISVNAADDGINAAGGADNSGFGGNWGRPGMPGAGGRTVSSGDNQDLPYIRISGGMIRITSDADGIDSNGNLIVSGGEIYISGPTNGSDSAIDYDGTASITGGIVVAVCRYGGMTQNFSGGSTQQTLFLTATALGTGDVIVEDASGNVLISYTPTKSYNAILVSCPQIVSGSTYTVHACGTTATVTK